MCIIVLSNASNFFLKFSFPILVSLDFHSDVQFTMLGELLYSDGDAVTLTWTPGDVLPSEISSPSDYQVTVEVYAYKSGAWTLFETVSTLDNYGNASISMLQQGPSGDEPIVPIAFRIKAVDSTALPSYIRPLVLTGQIGIWSPVAYKIAVPNYSAQTSCSEFVLSQGVSGAELLQNVPSCPCRVSQARMSNSRFTEQRSDAAIQMTRFLHPGADVCFVSATTG